MEATWRPHFDGCENNPKPTHAAIPRRNSLLIHKLGSHTYTLYSNNNNSDNDNIYIHIYIKNLSWSKVIAIDCRLWHGETEGEELYWCSDFLS